MAVISDLIGSVNWAEAVVQVSLLDQRPHIHGPLVLRNSLPDLFKALKITNNECVAESRELEWLAPEPDSKKKNRPRANPAAGYLIYFGRSTEIISAL
jgi:hypothetical protein